MLTVVKEVAFRRWEVTHLVASVCYDLWLENAAYLPSSCLLGMRTWFITEGIDIRRVSNLVFYLLCPQRITCLEAMGRFNLILSIKQKEKAAKYFNTDKDRIVCNHFHQSQLLFLLRSLPEKE